MRDSSLSLMARDDTSTTTQATGNVGECAPSRTHASHWTRQTYRYLAARVLPTATRCVKSKRPTCARTQHTHTRTLELAIITAIVLIVGCEHRHAANRLHGLVARHGLCAISAGSWRCAWTIMRRWLRQHA